MKLLFAIFSMAMMVTLLSKKEKLLKLKHVKNRISCVIVLLFLKYDDKAITKLFQEKNIEKKNLLRKKAMFPKNLWIK